MNTAGPGGLLIAWIFVAITSICVMEGVAEMVIMWPVSNAMVEYVKAFVDRDLAIVIGLAYWCVDSSIPSLSQPLVPQQLTLGAGTPGRRYSSPSSSLRPASLNTG
jgi:amino acid transporter